MSEIEEKVMLYPFHYWAASCQWVEDSKEMARLNYATSRIRAALVQWSISSTTEASVWWWTGLQNELDAAMAIVGHAAASTNIFLDIPILLRGLSQCMYHQLPGEIQFSKGMWEEIERVPDPHDPTEIFDEYYNDWWNKDNEWQTHQITVDPEKAFKWHIYKVKHFSLHPDPIDIFPIGSMEKFGGTSAQNCPKVPHHPLLLLLARPLANLDVLGEVKKANQVVRTLMANMEEERVSATRHIQHLKALRQYQLKNHMNALSPTDVKNLLYEVGDGHIDIDPTIPGPSTTSYHTTQPGPSITSYHTTRPSSDHSLTAESLSWNSYSDSDPDYCP
ncbi:hypothetical protein BYT27DRAFT_7253582 [Phlegmacium glaucopus]|nr:hypothetical protein BYT27DRAFT_7253582 [Phlegmacium glaucopus]